MSLADPVDVSVDGGADPGTPVWAVFGDLMAGLLGAFVLLLVYALAMQVDLSSRLDAEVKKRQAEEQRRVALEQALAIPLAEGRVTISNGRIGIASSVLFDFNSDELQPEGRRLIRSLAGPLTAYLAARDEVLMVSGFTDDRAVRGNSKTFADNWELSAQRALTVTRALVEDGVPTSTVFAAAFGAGQPVASNADAAGRALNRRVEITPLPRPKPVPATASAASAATPAAAASR